ncbi:GrdX family protein [Pyramidobacter piscolens]|nr:GrdX family protein [Pyramidobacter piscolens]
MTTKEVSVMPCRFILLTNNPRYEDRADLPVRFVAGAGKDVIAAGRDLIHKGWALQNHPLYGNFRPHQQPFRTLLLKKDENAGFDEYGLGLIEEAGLVYANDPQPLTPAQTPPRMAADCSEIDFELMKETLLKSNLIH